MTNRTRALMQRPYGDRRDERLEWEELAHERYLMRVDTAWEECGSGPGQPCQIDDWDWEYEDGVSVYYRRIDEGDAPSDPSTSVRSVSGDGFETNRRRH